MHDACCSYQLHELHRVAQSLGSLSAWSLIPDPIRVSWTIIMQYLLLNYSYCSWLGQVELHHWNIGHLVCKMNCWFKWSLCMQVYMYTFSVPLQLIICYSTDDGSEMVAREKQMCKLGGWFHLKCVTAVEVKKNDQWICNNCREV